MTFEVGGRIWMNLANFQHNFLSKHWLVVQNVVWTVVMGSSSDFEVSRSSLNAAFFFVVIKRKNKPILPFELVL